MTQPKQNCSLFKISDQPKKWNSSWKRSVTSSLSKRHSIPGPISPWIQLRNFSPINELRKGRGYCETRNLCRKNWMLSSANSVRLLARNSRNKANMAETQSWNFRAYRSLWFRQLLWLSGTTGVKWDAYDVENTAYKARRYRIHSKNSSRFHPGNRAEVLVWQHFPARLPRSRSEKPRSRESEPARSLIWTHR